MNKLFTQLFVAILVAILIAFLTGEIIEAAAKGFGIRSNACRTFHLFAHQKDIEAQQEIDGLFCGIESATKKDTAGSVNVPPVVDVPPADVTPPAEDKRVTINPQPNQPSNPVNPPVIVPVEPNPSNPSNPGNDKPVGNAGEKCNKGMCENSDGVSGEHGNSNND